MRTRFLLPCLFLLLARSVSARQTPRLAGLDRVRPAEAFRIAGLAAKRHKPGREFRALKDYTPFGEAADRILSGHILGALAAIRLDRSERVAFYAFGAAEGLLLDRASPNWRGRYLTEKFYTDRYFSR